MFVSLDKPWTVGVTSVMTDASGMLAGSTKFTAPEWGTFERESTDTDVWTRVA